ncbi:hypothetical protein Adt_46889 [Abeliophyllum distichum]|uniref:Uncharacterized protein n=1 Tax=Abeliophyllum distichum TaxID=126358 RepID=A0ABD1NZ88_9LAMI
MNRTHPNVIEPPYKPLDPDSNVVGLFPADQPTTNHRPNAIQISPMAQNSLQPTVALGKAPSAAALASTCRCIRRQPTGRCASFGRSFCWFHRRIRGGACCPSTGFYAWVDPRHHSSNRVGPDHFG